MQRQTDFHPCLDGFEVQPPLAVYPNEILRCELAEVRIAQSGITTEQEGIEHMDAIAALTGIDEENIIISLFAGRTTRAKAITTVNRSSYEPLVGSLSLDSVFYPRNICADNVVRYVRAMQNSDAYASMETLCKIVSNKVEAMEFRVTASADFCGIPLQDLHLKDGLLIGCISRGGKTITPRGSDTIEVGDSVIVVAAHSGLRSLNDIFTTRR